MAETTECARCGSAVTAQMRFCSNCGRKIYSKGRGFIPATLLLAVALMATGLGLQTILQGSVIRPPTVRGSGMSSEAVDTSVDAEYPELASMRKALEASPEDLSKMKIYAGMLGDKLRSNPGAPPALVFEAIDVLGRILQREPNDPAALVMMADVSFDQRAFTKALDFYERYLKIEAGDLGARSRYASTLTFLGRYDESIRELRNVLNVEPKNFPALAYLAITYAQKGEVSTAKKIGNDALSAAPSEDARARFSSFVASLDEATGGENAKGQTQQEPSSAMGKETQAGLDGLIATLKANPVAGPKFVKCETSSGGKLRLLYRDFPMSQMPPFAKDKFISGIRSAISQNGLTDVKELLFVDAGSAAVMESFVVSPK